MNAREWRAYFGTPAFDGCMTRLYAGRGEENKGRYEALLDLYEQTFGEADQLRLFSAPGRTEISGNHTDHQHGCVLAASVDMDMIAAASVNESGKVCVCSEGFPMTTVDLSDLTIHPEEKNTTASLIRGVLAAFKERGCVLKGLNAVVKSSVLPGSGISSSAAFEVLIGHMINGLFFEEKATAVEIAQIGQYAENVYFGKPSGLMDQTASSVGNMLMIDFEDNAHLVVRKLDVDFGKAELALCIIDSGADHADLTDEYAAIPAELKTVCRYFGKEFLREVPREEFISSLPQVRKASSDRAVLRALHVYGENERVPAQAKALEEGRIDDFLRMVRESGNSSWMYLQNISPRGAAEHQEMAVALSVCSLLLGDRGAFRVHGGGFAGTVQAFVPVDMLASFKQEVDRMLGEDSCHVLSVRPVGGVEIKANSI